MKSAITISLVDEARGGPFVFWGDIHRALEQAAELGFDAVEIFPPDAETLSHLRLMQPLQNLGLQVAAVGTGAGWVKHKLQLADEDREIRARAVSFIRSLIDCASELGASVIIGSMQGRSSPAVPRDLAASLLRDGLSALGEYAQKAGIRILYEPLNRYETDQSNTMAQGVAMIQGLGNVQLLADWFHMNIEESDVAGAIRQAGNSIGHVHFADSNRMAVGMGHLHVPPLIQALRYIGYEGYLSAEVFPKPNSLAAATKTIESYRALT
jgi:sugar phosphate isomerase/epimerase